MRRNPKQIHGLRNARFALLCISYCKQVDDVYWCLLFVHHFLYRDYMVKKVYLHTEIWKEHQEKYFTSAWFLFISNVTLNAHVCM
jgi:hypothetical protein